MNTTRARLQEALRIMAGKPGVDIAPPATSKMLVRAEDRLGRPLPPQLRELLSLANGLSVKHGLRRILGIEGGDYPDLIEFNSYGTWKYAWPQFDLRDLLVFSLTYDLNFNAYAGDDYSLVEGMLFLPRSLEDSRVDLVTKIERGWVRMAVQPMHAEDEDLYRELGPLSPGEGVFLGPKFFVSGEPDLSELQRKPLEEGLRMSGSLHTHTESLPPGVRIIAPFLEHDELGRERWRWITDQDLPGFTEQMPSGGTVSNITVDGMTPDDEDRAQ